MTIVRLCFSFVRSLAINYIINVLDLLSLSLSMFADDQTKPKSGRYFFFEIVAWRYGVRTCFLGHFYFWPDFPLLSKQFLP